MITKILKYIIFPSRYFKYSNSKLLSMELNIKSRTAKIVYWIIQFLLFPKKKPNPSIIEMTEERQQLSEKHLTLSKENLWNVSIIAKSANIYFDNNIEAYCRKNPLSYTMNLDGYFNKEELSIINKISEDRSITNHAGNWLKTECELKKIIIYANFPNKRIVESEGSKLWHRDADVYEAAEYYINITACGEDNGPLYIFKDPCANRLFQPHFPKELENLDQWRKCRWLDKDLERFAPINYPLYVTSNKGSAGKITFLDSGIHMHKGGATKLGRRIVMRIIYGHKSVKTQKPGLKGYWREVVIKKTKQGLLKLKTFG